MDREPHPEVRPSLRIRVISGLLSHPWYPRNPWFLLRCLPPFPVIRAINGLFSHPWYPRNPWFLLRYLPPFPRIRVISGLFSHP